MSTVLPSQRFSMAASMSAWFSGSAALVASSNMRTGASFRMARAMATRCRSPPESFPPSVPMGVS